MYRRFFKRFIFKVFVNADNVNTGEIVAKTESNESLDKEKVNEEQTTK